MYKAVISDFDGTLATSDKRVSNENFSAIERLLRQGKKFALCTGRMTSSAMTLVEKLPFKPLIATYNGGEVVDSATGKLLVRHTLDPEIMLDVIEYGRQKGLYYQIFDDDVIVEKITKLTEVYCSICRVKAREVGDLYIYIKERNFRSPKIMLINYGGEVDTIITEIIARLGGKAEVCRCQDGMIDITPKGVDKGSAVKDLSEIWGISPSECIAIGDEGNDVSMFNTAGLGVAMINAREEVRAKADYVTERDNDHDGVAEVIEKFALGR